MKLYLNYNAVMYSKQTLLVKAYLNEHLSNLYVQLAQYAQSRLTYHYPRVHVHLMIYCIVLPVPEINIWTRLSVLYARKPTLQKFVCIIILFNLHTVSKNLCKQLNPISKAAKQPPIKSLTITTDVSSSSSCGRPYKTLRIQEQAHRYT